MALDPGPDRDSVRECPECGREGHQTWVLGHWHCPKCQLTFKDDGEEVTQYEF